MRGTDPINSTWVYPNFVKLQIAIKHAWVLPTCFLLLFCYWLVLMFS